MSEYEKLWENKDDKEYVFGYLNSGQHVPISGINSQESILVYYIKNHNHEMFEAVIDSGVYINQLTGRSGGLLHAAVVSSNIHAVKYLVENGINVNMTDKNGFTALMLSLTKSEIDTYVLFPNRKIVNYLIDKTSYINASDIEGYSALMVAVISNDLISTKKIIKKGADLNQYNDSGFTALFLAIENNNIDIIDVLMQHDLMFHGIKNEYLIDFINSMALTDTAIDKKIEIFNYLSQYEKLDADELLDALIISKRDNLLDSLDFYSIVKIILKKSIPRKGETLILATSIRDIELIDLLISNGMDINSISKEGDTALIKSTDYAFNQLLLERGADASIINNGGHTAFGLFEDINLLKNELSHGVFSFSSFEASMGNDDALNLIQKHKQLNIVNHRGETILFSPQMGLDMMSLIELGVDPSIKNNKGRTVSYQLNGIELTNVLEVSNINTQDNEGISLLMATKINETGKFVKLIDHNIDVFLLDNKGRNALFYAFIEGIPPNDCKKLINKGIDVNLQDKDGLTAPMLISSVYFFKYKELINSLDIDYSLESNDGKTLADTFMPINKDAAIEVSAIQNKVLLAISNQDTDERLHL